MESFEPSSENRFRADSLLGRINSLLPRIRFPVVVELIPCSVAQGIHFREPRKLLNSQMFSGPIFHQERPKSSKFVVVSLYGVQLHGRRITCSSCPKAG